MGKKFLTTLSLALIFIFSSCSLLQNSPNEADKQITTKKLQEILDQGDLNLSNLGLSKIPNFPTLMTGSLADEVTSISLQSNKIEKINGENFLVFKNLKRLNLSFNKIKSTNGVGDLSKLKILKNLNLTKSGIEKLNGIEKLINITDLYLSFNKIEDISNLENLKNLSYLELAHNKISDISAISQLDKLKTLKIEFNQVSDLTSILTNTGSQIEVLTAKFNNLPEELTNKLYKINIKNLEAREEARTAEITKLVGELNK